MSLGEKERRNLSSLIEKLGEHVINAEVKDGRSGQYLVLKSKATGVILCQFDLDACFDKDGNYFVRDVG